jgi:hypothetical protein
MHIKAYGLPEPIHDDLEFQPGRKWRFDFAWPAYMLAVEVQGGAWTGKGHTGGEGYRNDCEKLNAAALAGWTVLWYTTEMVQDASAIDQIREFFRRM